MTKDTTKLTWGKKPLMVAHRGTLVVEQGNSLPSFRFAAGKSYWGIECDIHTTKDKHIVVNHDHDIGTTCDRAGVIEETDWAELQKARINPIYPDAPHGGEDMRLPTFREYMDICRAGGKVCVTELKGRFSDEDIDRVLAQAREAGCMESTVFISFDLDNCIRLRKRLPECPIQFLTGGYDAGVLNALDTYDLDLDIYHGAVSAQVVKEVHEHGHKINVWTVDALVHGDYFASIGVDFITSNFLE